jgi:HAD superfamily hydrolase (TIGR01490 family)
MVHVAVFDLDGTILDGESPLILTKQLLRRRQMPLTTAVKMGVWGLRYRLRLPQTESTPRELLFSVLTEQTAEEVDAEIVTIYERRIRKKINPGAIEEIERCRAQGLVMILASASFKPITTAVVEDLKFDGQVCTIMEEKDGHYTGHVVGVPVEGQEKLRAFRAYCDERFGEGQWQIDAAFSDHYSDIPLLSCSCRSVAVDPDGRLERVAKGNGWEIADWS